MGNERSGRPARACARGNRRTRRELQGHTAKIRARARGILRHHARQCLERVYPSVILDLAFKSIRKKREPRQEISARPERNHVAEVLSSSAATLPEVKA